MTFNRCMEGGREDRVRNRQTDRQTDRGYKQKNRHTETAQRCRKGHLQTDTHTPARNVEEDKMTNNLPNLCGKNTKRHKKQ